MSEKAMSNEKLLTKKDVSVAYRRWYWFAEVSHCYDRMQALSFMSHMSKALRKLYKDDEEYKAALKRNLQFFNTEGTIGSVIHGMALSMEEERAGGADIPDEVMYSLRTALMGPMAGIGDTLIWGTYKPICLALATTLAISGNILALVIALLFPIGSYFIGKYLHALGYGLGRNAVMSMIKSGMMNRIITACGILGLMMMGALSASYVSLNVATQFTLENNASPIVVQDILNQIAPGLLPLLVIGLIYFYIKKHNQKYGMLIILIIALSIVASFFGIV